MKTQNIRSKLEIGLIQLWRSLTTDLPTQAGASALKPCWHRHAKLPGVFTHTFPSSRRHCSSKLHSSTSAEEKELRPLIHSRWERQNYRDAPAKTSACNSECFCFVWRQSTGLSFQEVLCTVTGTDQPHLRSSVRLVPLRIPKGTSRWRSRACSCIQPYPDRPAGRSLQPGHTRLCLWIMAPHYAQLNGTDTHIMTHSYCMTNLGIHQHSSSTHGDNYMSKSRGYWCSWHEDHMVLAPVAHIHQYLPSRRKTLHCDKWDDCMQTYDRASYWVCIK